MKPIVFAVVGTGAMAEAMLGAFRHSKEVKVEAVVSASLSRAQAFGEKHSIAKSYEAMSSMLEDSSIDAVYIANSTRAHSECAIAALRAGKHVLCEKPMAMNLEETRRVIEAASESSCLFMEALWTHFLPTYQHLYRLLKEKNFGTPLHLTTDFGYPVDPSNCPGLFSKEGGGVLPDRAVYPISMALKVFGPIESIDAQLQFDGNGIDVHAAMQTRHEGGGTAQLAVSFRGLMSNTASLSTTEGLVTLLSPILGAERIKIERCQPGTSASASGGFKAALKSSAFVRRAKSVLESSGLQMPYGANQYLPQLNHFVELLKEGKRQSAIVPHQLSLDVSAAIDNIRQMSAGEG